jgi:hypothetical protein
VHYRGPTSAADVASSIPTWRGLRGCDRFWRRCSGDRGAAVDEEPMTVSREEDKPKVSSSSPMRCSLLAFGGIGKEFMNFDAFRVRFDVVVVVV